MSIQTVLTAKIPERTTPKITAVIKDENGVAIPDTSLDTLTLDLYNMSDDPVFAVINSRTAQNVLNANDVTVDTSGILVWQMVTADNAIIDATLKTEKHRAVFNWTYSSGIKTGRHIIDLTVVNLEKI